VNPVILNEWKRMNIEILQKRLVRVYKEKL
jgi:hypothetical protein